MKLVSDGDNFRLIFASKSGVIEEIEIDRNFLADLRLIGRR